MTNVNLRWNWFGSVFNCVKIMETWHDTTGFLWAIPSLSTNGICCRQFLLQIVNKHLCISLYNLFNVTGKIGLVLEKLFKLLIIVFEINSISSIEPEEIVETLSQEPQPLMTTSVVFWKGSNVLMFGMYPYYHFVKSNAVECNLFKKFNNILSQKYQI